MSGLSTYYTRTGTAHLPPPAIVQSRGHEKVATYTASKVNIYHVIIKTLLPSTYYEKGNAKQSLYYVFYSAESNP